MASCCQLFSLFVAVMPSMAYSPRHAAGALAAQPMSATTVLELCSTEWSTGKHPNCCSTGQQFKQAGRQHRQKLWWGNTLPFIDVATSKPPTNPTLATAQLMSGGPATVVG